MFMYTCLHSMFGDAREMELHYFLADDTIELLERIPPNSGRDAVSTFLKRARLPKVSLILVTNIVFERNENYCSILNKPHALCTVKMTQLNSTVHFALYFLWWNCGIQDTATLCQLRFFCEIRLSAVEAEIFEYQLLSHTMHSIIDTIIIGSQWSATAWY